MLKNQWDDYLKKNLFSDHDGFFELPYLSNSPETMIASVANMPVSNHVLSEQAIYSDDAFTKGVMRYRKVDDGLWLLAADIEINRNIISKALYATDDADQYYFLSFAIFEYDYPVNNTFTAFAKLLSTTCTFYRPGTEVTTFFYEGTKGKFFNLVFNKEWVANNLLAKDALQDSTMLSFLNNDTGFINWIDLVPDAFSLGKTIYATIENETDGKFDTLFLKEIMLSIISDFFAKAVAEKRINTYAPLHNPDYANIAAAEKLIINNLHLPFFGVENIAREVNVSPTKLKKSFKAVFGFSMLQYHKEKNMLLAMQLIKRSEMHIKNIALITGYETPNKFTATFKKRFGLLPSEVRGRQQLAVDNCNTKNYSLNMS